MCSRLLPAVLILASFRPRITTATVAVPSVRTSVPVRCRTTQGDLDLLVHHRWAPLGADRFLRLVRAGFYTQAALYRCVPDFVLQWDCTSCTQP